MPDLIVIEQMVSNFKQLIKGFIIELNQSLRWNPTMLNGVPDAIQVSRAGANTTIYTNCQQVNDRKKTTRTKLYEWFI